MQESDKKIHSATDGARGGSTPNVVRWVLVISLAAAVVLLSAVWIFGAMGQGADDQNVQVSETISDTQDRGNDTDGVLGGDADEFAPATPADMAADETGDPTRTTN